MTLVDEYTKERLVRAAKELIGDLKFAQQMGCRELQIEYALARAKESLMWLEDIDANDDIEYEETE